MAGYDDWKSTPPAMPSGSGRINDHSYRCTVCHQRFDAINALWHAQATGHTIVSRHGVVQVFSGVQAPLAAWAW